MKSEEEAKKEKYKTEKQGLEKGEEEIDARRRQKTSSVPASDLTSGRDDDGDDNNNNSR